jgi:nucleoside-diphosphate-sugar epimerase
MGGFGMNSLANYKAFYDKNVLITGGLGFIGSNLARKLVDLGASVTLIDSMIPEYGGNIFNISGIEDRVRVNISDVRDVHCMQYLIQDQDYLFNLAGQTSHVDSMQDPYTDLEINCRAQLSILETCRKFNSSIKVVFASTRQIYGRPSYLPVDEKHPLRPVDVNGINKVSGEWYHLLYNDVYGIKACALRMTNTYGPRMRIKDARQTFLGIWIRQLIEGKPILVFGDGTQKRDLCYVDDATHALLLAAINSKADGGVYNIGSKEVISLRDLAELIIEIKGCGVYNVVPFPEDRKTIDIGDYYADYSKIRKDLSWVPEVSLKDGLNSVILYYDKNFDKYM